MKLIVITALGAIATSAYAQAPAAAPAGMDRTQFEAMVTRKYTGFDTDKDGSISVAEMIAAQTKPGSPAPQADAIQRRLAKLDVDHDGKVSIKEGLTSEQPRFDRMDTNKDGIVTPEEKANEKKG